MNSSKHVIQIEFTPTEARVIAEESYIFGYAMVENDKTMYGFCINQKSALKRSAQIVLLSVLSCFLFAPDAVAQRFQANEPTFFDEGHEQLERNIEQLQQSQPAPVLTIDASIQQWQPIASQTGGFSVWVPLGILSDDTETIPVGAMDLEFRILSSQTSVGKFVLAYADAPDTESAQLFASVKDALVERTAFEIRTVERITVDGGVGESLILTGDAELISVYVLLGNDRLYVVGVRQTGGSAPSEAATRFLKSFHLNSEMKQGKL